MGFKWFIIGMCWYEYPLNDGYFKLKNECNDTVYIRTIGGNLIINNQLL